MTTEKRLMPTRGLYVITDYGKLDPLALIGKTEKILAAGISILQYRDKSEDQARRLDTAQKLGELCNRAGTIFLINDDVQLAIETGADGVHLGRDDCPFTEARALLGDDAIIGISCYNEIQAARAAQLQGADYIAFGAFYPTRTKTGTVQARPELLTQAKSELTVPVAAIGGITPDNGRTLVEAGADMLAVISSVYEVDEPGPVVLKFNALFQ